MKTKTFTLLALTALFTAVPFACAGPPELVGVTPPTGVGGGYNPGDGGLVSGSGSGAGSGVGTGGMGGDGGSGPPMCDDTLKRCDHLFTYPAGNESSVEVRGDFAPDAWTAGIPMIKSGGSWTATVKLPWSTDVLYKFYVDGSMWVTDPTNPLKVDDGFGGFNSKVLAATCDVWTCDDPPVTGSIDWRDAVLYFVFVDRFRDGNPANNGVTPPGVEPAAAYQGGDWAGVLQKIDDGYFTDLGVNTLWLTVPMENTNSAGHGLGGDSHNYSAYHGYWPRNLDQPEEHFGTMVDLKKVVDAAHAKGINVLLDYAMNHVHIEAPVYAQHKDWFWPLDDGSVSNCVCGQGCSWDDSYQQKRCWFADYLPDFNFTVDAARKYSVDNAITWIKDTGIDGFRLDAVKHIETSWISDLRSRVKAEIEPAHMGNHFYMVGETFSTVDRNIIKKYISPTTLLDGQFDFPLRGAIVTSLLTRSQPMSSLEGFMNSNDAFYGAGVMSTFIGNHDIPRPIHFAQDAALWGNEWDSGKDKSWSNQPGIPGGTSAFERLANAFTVLLTTKGVPLIYYGDEIGMPGAGDPDNRRMMQWSNYSAGQSYLLGRIKKLTKIRADHPALRRGTRTTVSVNTDTYGYKMETAGDTVYVVINRSDQSQQVGNLPGGSFTDLLNGGTVNGPSVTVSARSARVLTSP
jgi:glycosidase